MSFSVLKAQHTEHHCLLYSYSLSQNTSAKGRMRVFLSASSKHNPTYYLQHIFLSYLLEHYCVHEFPDLKFNMSNQNTKPSI